MKTNMIKTATFIFAVVITTTLNAQNTKSFRENRLAEKFGKFIRENVSKLDEEINGLRSIVQFKPSANFEYTSETSEMVLVDLNSLEKVVKYKPTVNYNTEISTGHNDNDFSTVLEELKKTVKYQPSVNGQVNEWEKITSELAVVVRYQPQS